MDRFIRRAEILEITGLSPATIYRWIAKGNFPAPRQLGPNSVGWRASAVEEWIDSREPALKVPETSPPESEPHDHDAQPGSES